MMAEKSNIFTSNITTLEELEEIFGSRLASRIYTASEIIELKGMDMR
jgi:DNA replication protein DnaC